MRLDAIHDALLERYGPQGWWPARTRFEMAMGAILVQNTRWANAAKAVAGLRRDGWLTAGSMAAAPLGPLEACVRPAGFWRQKAARLKGFARWLTEVGGFDRLADLETPELRSMLMGLEGIGPETADCILVYAFRRPVFIADAYARSLLRRLGLLPDGAEDYESVRRWAEARLPGDSRLMNEFHALIVEHAKQRCGRLPVCEGCCLLDACPTGADSTERRSSGR